MKCCKEQRTAEEQIKDVEKYPGAAINEADDCKESKKLVDERTETLNNNPRNDK